MLILLSKKASEQIKLPLLEKHNVSAENRYCEWCTDIFTVDRRKYFLICNAYSLYGVCFSAKGITSAQKFMDTFTTELKEYLVQKGLSKIFLLYMSENTTKNYFCRAYDTHVRAAMNSLKQRLPYIIRNNGSSERINDIISKNITSTFSDTGDYQEPDTLFVSDMMKKTVTLPDTHEQKDTVSAIQFYIELNDFSPKLWRRFIIRQDAKMTTLAYAILSMTRASGGHLFRFETTQTEFHREYISKAVESPFLKNTDLLDLPIGMLEAASPATYIELPDPEDDTYNSIKTLDARKVRTGRIFMDSTTRCLFTYDFGDNWEFSLKAEKTVSTVGLTTVNPVKVIDGENYGIVDDCGGTDGLQNLIAAFKKGSGSQYKELSEWMGINNFDFTAFNLTEINRNLRSDIRMHKSNYEDEQW